MTTVKWLCHRHFDLVPRRQLPRWHVRCA